MLVNKFTGFGGIDTGTIIRMLRVQAGLSQEELAFRLHINSATISYIENGHRDMYIKTFEEMLNYFGYHLEVVNNNAT